MTKLLFIIKLDSNIYQFYSVSTKNLNCKHKNLGNSGKLRLFDFSVFNPCLKLFNRYVVQPGVVIKYANVAQNPERKREKTDQSG